MLDKINETANVMAAYTITRGQLLLQYYAALRELEEEARSQASARGERVRRVQPIFLHEELAALPEMEQAAGAA
jgi:hypothetical protein